MRSSIRPQFASSGRARLAAVRPGGALDELAAIDPAAVEPVIAQVLDHKLFREASRE